MKNWVTKLLLLLFVPALAGMLFVAILGYNSSGWLQIAAYALPPLLALVGSIYTFGLKWKAFFVVLMVVAGIAFNVPLQNWMFHSADEAMRFASITDLYDADGRVLYFAFDTLEVDYARRSNVTITREVTHKTGRHRYRKEKRQYHYSVVPVFADSLPRHRYAEREVKAWVVPVKHEKGKPVICYERCLFDLEGYQKAIDKSRCRIHHPQAPVIRPLYSQFITRREWRGIFFQVAWVVLSVLIVLGMVLNHRESRG